MSRWREDLTSSDVAVLDAVVQLWQVPTGAVGG